jgi:hypothetical protein
MVYVFVLIGHLIIQLGVFGNGDDEDEDASKRARFLFFCLFLF